LTVSATQRHPAYSHVPQRLARPWHFSKTIKIIKFILNTYKEDFFKLCIISNNLIKKQTKKTAHQRAASL
ncbi:hypothetical protein, partial [Pasteurella multocida]